MSKKSRVRYFESFEDDFFQSGEKHRVSNDYRWIRDDIFSRFLSVVIYTLELIFSNIYCRLFLRVSIKGAKKLREDKNSGFFLYANHSQPIGDIFNPALACFPKRIYTVVSPANFALAGIGKTLYYLGALPTADSISKIKEFNSAIEQRIRCGHPIVIYPEAHLWEYYTDIRPFCKASFKYPVKLGVRAYCMTTTYSKTSFRKKPKITIYIDGPFKADTENANIGA